MSIRVAAGGTGPAAGLVWRGTWSAATAYVVNDAVTRSGSSYRRVVAGTTATAPESDATNWELVASKGDTGATGSAGTGSTLNASNNGGTPFSIDQLDVTPGLNVTDTGTGGKMAVIGEKIWLHQGFAGIAPPALDGTGDQTATFNAIAAAATVNAKQATIGSCPGLMRATGQLTLPDEVAFYGPGNDAAFEIIWGTDPGAGNYYIQTGDVQFSGRVILKDVLMHMIDTPVNVTSLAPPSTKADGLFTGRGVDIEGVHQRGNPRYGAVTNSDHQRWRRCLLTGWASFAFLGAHATYGDYYWDDCQMTAAMCNWYCEQGTQMGGTVRGGHAGFSPIVLMMADGAGSVGIGMRFVNSAIESFGCFLGFDPSGLNTWNVLKFTDCTAAGMWDSNSQFRLFFSTTVATDTAASGTYSLPLTAATNFPSRGSAYINGTIINWTGKSTNTLTGVTGGSGTLTAGTFIKPIYGDALLRGGSMSNCDFSGNGDIFLKFPQSPNGTMFRINGPATNVAMPNLGQVMGLADAQEKPLAEMGAISSVTGTYNASTVRFKRRRNASPTPRKGDVMRVGLVTGGEYTERFQVIGAAVAGVVAGGQGAYAAATTNNPIITIVAGAADVRVQNVGDTLINGNQSIPTDGASTTTTEAVTLGPVVRTDEGSSLAATGAQTLRLQDPYGITTSGRLSVGGKAISYTGITGDQLTGITAASAPGFVDAGVALGRVVSVTSASGFSSSGGLALLDGQLVTYTGKSGSDIIGINGGTGLVASGATIVPKASLKIGSLRNFIAGVNSIQVGGHLYSIAGFQSDPIGTGGSTAAGWLLSPALPASDSFAGTISSNAVAVAGTQTNGAHGASPATLTVDSTTGFPSKGKLHAPDGAGGLVVGTYTGKTATTFTGCTWSAAPTIPDNTPITIAVGLIVAAGDKWVRPAFATGQNSSDDQGLVVEASSHLDAAGEAFAFSMAAIPDNGATVPVAVRSRFG